MITPVAVITGASRGIGKAVATYFASKAYRVVLIARNGDALATLAHELRAEYAADVQYHTVDVSVREQVKNACASISKQYQRVDVLFNNAGIIDFGCSAIAPDTFDNILNTNVRGAYHWVHYLLPLMQQQQSGYIFNMSSRAAKFANPGTGAYALSKAALLNYSYALSRELITDNIKVTALCPGAVDTELLDQLDFGSSTLDRSKIIKTDDVVKIINCLLSLSGNVVVPEILLDNIKSPLFNVEQYKKG